MNIEMERAVDRARALTDELSVVLGFIRTAVPDLADPGARERSVVDATVLSALVESLGSAEDVMDLTASFTNGLTARGEQILELGPGDDLQSKRLLVDLRAVGDLLGATGLVAWCRLRATDPAAASAPMLRSVIEDTRRALALWRLSPVDADPSRGVDRSR